MYRRGSREAEVIETVEQMLRFVELCEVRQRHPYDLSGGQMQRLAVAKALLTKPRSYYWMSRRRDWMLP